MRLANLNLPKKFYPGWLPRKYLPQISSANIIRYIPNYDVGFELMLCRLL